MKHTDSTAKRGRSSRFIKKPLQFNIRMSTELRAELDNFAKLGGRPLSYQIEHMIAIAKLAMDFCEGSDNLRVVANRLEKAKRVLTESENK